MGTVNYANPSIDQTVKLFDTFYAYEVSVPQLEFDAVFSYFLSVFETKEAAGNFTTTLFRISTITGQPVMNLLQEIQGLGTMELTLALSYYLNSQRSNSTLLGVNATVTPNYYVARNIRP